MIYKSFILCILLLFFGPGTGLSYSQEENETDAVISDLTATTSETHLLLFCTLRNSFTEEMIEGLHSGVPVHFSFFVELYQQTARSGNTLLAKHTFIHTLTYDTLKETYRVELEEDKKKNFFFTSLLDAQNTINELNGFKVVPLSSLTPDRTYILQVRAELFNKTLPLSLQHVVPFVAWWDIETDWQKLTFKY